MKKNKKMAQSRNHFSNAGDSFSTAGKSFLTGLVSTGKGVGCIPGATAEFVRGVRELARDSQGREESLKTVTAERDSMKGFLAPIVAAAMEQLKQSEGVVVPSPAAPAAG